ncbi:MAG: 30S ribosomal protein S3 [Candidatus Pacebacteria bacterium]|nr:30S ribosomal protein S3 [Candidatus Paceibacterota bacterium]
MTHVAHPYAQRLGIIRGWKSRWFARDTQHFKEFLRTDTLLREWFKKRLKGMYVADIEFERHQNALRIVIKTARPGMLIGRSGEGVQRLHKDIAKKLRTMKLSEIPEVKMDIEEVRTPESNAQIVAEMVVEGLEKRMPFRRILKQTVEKVMANRDVLGVRIGLAGRIGGAEMSRNEEIKKGRVPLQTLRADVDFAHAEAYIAYTGLIGVKVWIYKGDIFEGEQRR